MPMPRSSTVSWRWAVVLAMALGAAATPDCLQRPDATPRFNRRHCRTNHTATAQRQALQSELASLRRAQAQQQHRHSDLVRSDGDLTLSTTARRQLLREQARKVQRSHRVQQALQQLDAAAERSGAPRCTRARVLYDRTLAPSRFCPARPNKGLLGRKVQIMTSLVGNGGFGLFATRPIAPGEVLGDFPGVPTPAATIVARGLAGDGAALARKLSTVFRVHEGSTVALDPTEPDGTLAVKVENSLAFVNEPPPGTQPNVRQVWTSGWPVQFVAARPIEWGDELFVCYFWPREARGYAVNPQCVGTS